MYVASNYLHQTDRFCIVVGKWVHMVVVAGHLEIKSRDVTMIILVILFIPYICHFFYAGKIFGE